MKRQYATRNQQQSKSETPLVSGILQRAGVYSVPEKEVQHSDEIVSPSYREAGFHQDFSQVPVQMGTPFVIEPKLRVGRMGNKYEERNGEAKEVVQHKGGDLQHVHSLRTGQGLQAKVAEQNESVSKEAEIEGKSISASGADRENRTGLPDNLKAGIESLSGLSMDDVRVHYNSGKPAQLRALAYAQGTDIHVAPGQEQHLPHEAWHVVQQKQGRVQPTLQAKNAAINDDVGLEKEADLMGKKAISRPIARSYLEGINKKFRYTNVLNILPKRVKKNPSNLRQRVIQRTVESNLE